MSSSGDTHLLPHLSSLAEVSPRTAVMLSVGSTDPTLHARLLAFGAMSVTTDADLPDLTQISAIVARQRAVLTPVVAAALIGIADSYGASITPADRGKLTTMREAERFDPALCFRAAHVIKTVQARLRYIVRDRAEMNAALPLK